MIIFYINTKLIGYTNRGIILTKLIEKFDPDMIMIEGDIAYDDGMSTYYYSWDPNLGMFEDNFRV
jgi:hypothetical protein